MNSQQTNKSPFSYRALLTVILIITVAALLWHVLESAHSIQEKIHQAKPWLGLWRLSLFVLLIGFWPKLVQVTAKYVHWSEAYQTNLKALRWRIAGWLIIIELVLVQGVVNRFIGEFMP